MQNRKSTAYNEVVGITKDGYLFVLEETFAYESGLHGAIRFEMEALTQAEIDQNNELETVKDAVKDMWLEAVKNGYEESLTAYAEEQIGNDPERYFLWDDPSFRSQTDRAVEKSEHKAEINKQFADRVDWNCVCYGRCGKEVNEDYFETVYRPDLLEAIKQAEA